jgi:hypothetical protein
MSFVATASFTAGSLRTVAQCSAIVHSRRPSRYKLITFFVAVITGIVVADVVFPASRSWPNLLLAAAVAAVVAGVMAWVGGRRKDG